MCEDQASASGHGQRSLSGMDETSIVDTERARGAPERFSESKDRTSVAPQWWMDSDHAKWSAP